jgi:hypothetical protein
MYKKLITITLAIITTGSLFSQQHLRFTVFANPSINWLKSDVKDVSFEAPTMGFDAGLTLDKFFAERYAISTGISIGSFGGKLKYNEETNFSVHGEDAIVAAGSIVKYKLQYITIPLGLKFKTNEIGYFTYYAHLGLTTQFNVKSTADSGDGTLDKSNVGEDIGFANLGYHFGLGTEYALGNSAAIVFGLTYTNGFIDITSHQNDKITLAGIALRLGILF